MTRDGGQPTIMTSFPSCQSSARAPTAPFSPSIFAFLNFHFSPTSSSDTPLSPYTTSRPSHMVSGFHGVRDSLTARRLGSTDPFSDSSQRDSTSQQHGVWNRFKVYEPFDDSTAVLRLEETPQWLQMQHGFTSLIYVQDLHIGLY
jgi:hypothetical protein